MTTTTKTTSKKSSKSSHHVSKATAALRERIFEAKVKRCGHKSEDGKKVCGRFAGHTVAHFYVAPADLKKKEAAFKERFATA